VCGESRMHGFGAERSGRPLRLGQLKGALTWSDPLAHPGVIQLFLLGLLAIALSSIRREELGEPTVFEGEVPLRATFLVLSRVFLRVPAGFTTNPTCHRRPRRRQKVVFARIQACRSRFTAPPTAPNLEIAVCSSQPTRPGLEPTLSGAENPSHSLA